MREPCCVADQFCEAPANLESSDRPAKLPVCFACGESVCGPCSLRVEWMGFGRHRVCHSCIEDEDGHDERPMAHLRRLVKG